VFFHVALDATLLRYIDVSSITNVRAGEIWRERKPRDRKNKIRAERNAA